MRHEQHKLRPIVAHPTDPCACFVQLTQGKWAIIDTADAVAVGRWNWSFKADRKNPQKQYAHSSCGKKKGKVTLHRFIGALMGLRLSALVDHRDRNGLDCRRSNLRDATNGQNRSNSKLNANSQSGIKGVVFCTDGRWKRPWQARCVANGKRVQSYFATKEDAAAFVAAVRTKLHGEFANAGKDMVQ